MIGSQPLVQVHRVIKELRLALVLSHHDGNIPLADLRHLGYYFLLDTSDLGNTPFKTRPHFLPLGYSSLFGQCLRLVSYAVRTLPRLWLRAFRPRSSLPSLYYRTADNSVAAHETTAANDSAGRGGVKRSRLLAILPLTKRREEGIRLRPVS